MGVFFGRQDGGFHVVEVGEGLEYNQICSGVLGGHHHLPVQLVGVVEGQGAQRLQQLPDGAAVEGHIGLRPGSGIPCHLDGLGDDLGGGVAAVLQLVPVGLEGVGIDDLTAGGDIAAVDIGHHLRVSEAEQFRQLTQL